MNDIKEFNRDRVVLRTSTNENLFNIYPVEQALKVAKILRKMKFNISLRPRANMILRRAAHRMHYPHLSDHAIEYMSQNTACLDHAQYVAIYFRRRTVYPTFNEDQYRFLPINAFQHPSKYE